MGTRALERHPLLCDHALRLTYQVAIVNMGEKTISRQGGGYQ
jgi:hypothetical protein